MANKPYELSLYRVRYGLTDRKMLYDTYVAIEGAGDSSLDEATELAEEVRLKINADTGLDYQMQFLGSVGTVYVWKKI